MIRYNKSVIDWFLEQQLLSSDPVNNCIMLITRQYKTNVTVSSVMWRSVFEIQLIEKTFLPFLPPYPIDITNFVTVSTLCILVA
jgi:hypothetical protein